MEITEQTIAAVRAARAAEPGWFAARQPALRRHLESRLEGDALAAGLDAAMVVVSAYEAALGLPPPRLESALLDHAEDLLVSGEPEAGAALARQPALVRLIEQTLASPPLPLEEPEVAALGLSLGVLVTALESAACGLPLPPRR